MKTIKTPKRPLPEILRKKAKAIRKIISAEVMEWEWHYAV
jgi:hypothetical protein